MKVLRDLNPTQMDVNILCKWSFHNFRYDLCTSDTHPLCVPSAPAKGSLYSEEVIDLPSWTWKEETLEEDVLEWPNYPDYEGLIYTLVRGAPPLVLGVSVDPTLPPPPSACCQGEYAH